MTLTEIATECGICKRTGDLSAHECMARNAAGDVVDWKDHPMTEWAEVAECCGKAECECGPANDDWINGAYIAQAEAAHDRETMRRESYLID